MIYKLLFAIVFTVLLSPNKVNAANFKTEQQTQVYRYVEHPINEAVLWERLLLRHKDPKIEIYESLPNGGRKEYVVSSAIAELATFDKRDFKTTQLRNLYLFKIGIHIRNKSLSSNMLSTDELLVILKIISSRSDSDPRSLAFFQSDPELSLFTSTADFISIWLKGLKEMPSNETVMQIENALKQRQSWIARAKHEYDLGFASYKDDGFNYVWGSLRSSSIITYMNLKLSAKFGKSPY